MEANLEPYDMCNEYTLAEIEVDDETVLRPNELQLGATILVSNESDGSVDRIISHDELLKLFAPPISMPIPTEVAVERTLADPALKQILQEAENKPDFDAQAEQIKLREFLAGANNSSNNININSQLSTEEILQQAPRQLMPPSTAYRIIKCANCSALFDILSFQNHTCEYDGDQTLIELTSVQDKRIGLAESSPSIQKPASERVLMENQIRIRRYMKEELKYDLDAGYDEAAARNKSKSTKGPNECSMCERKFVHASGLVRHMEKHTLDLIPIPPTVPSHSAGSSGVAIAFGGPPTHDLRVVLQCQRCGRIFYDINMALDHIIVHHPEEPQLAAPTSSAVPQEDLARNLEQLVQQGEKLLDAISARTEEQTKTLQLNGGDIFTMLILTSVLQCEFCDYIFADISYLLVHSSTHLPERRYECTACDVHMSTSKEASLHYQTDCIFMREGFKQLQVALNRYFVCNVCELKFSNSELLQEHRYSCYHYFPRLSQSRQELLLPCEFCDINFEYAHEIQPHYEEKHLNKKKREKEARNSGGPVTARVRQYLCDICGKSYTQSSHLWQHLRFHQGVKPFVCTEKGCGRKFTIRPDLNDHIRKCHTGERPYHCLVCGKRFLTGSVFYQHRLIHRGERRYECEECGKRFYRADALKNHQRIHTGEKPYSCLFCTKTFRQRGDRDKHIRARHAHLDANSRLMMQMQKFQLESAAAAAALKAKKLQEQPEATVRSGTAAVAGTANSAPTPPFPMLPQQQMLGAVPMNEFPANNFQNVVPQFVQGMAMNNTEPQMIVYQKQDMPNVGLNPTSMHESQQSKMRMSK